MHGVRVCNRCHWNQKIHRGYTGMGPCFPNQHRVRALLSHLLINMSLKVSCKHKLVIFSSILTLLFHWKENKIQEDVMEFSKEIRGMYFLAFTFIYLFLIYWLFKRFFLMWTIFKAFIESVTISLLFYVLVFWSRVI